jgi:predicted amidophosphoribosyltransferase
MIRSIRWRRWPVETPRWAMQAVVRVAADLPRWTKLLARSMLNLALPPICAGCECDIASPDDVIPLCQACRRTFDPPAGPLCPRCAAPAPAASLEPAGCVHCHDTSFRFHQIAALGVYEQGLQAFVLRMKQRHGEALTLAAGRLLAHRIRATPWPQQPDLVTAAPMHWTRRLHRGVNAAALLAEAVAGELRLPLALGLVRTMRNVPRQSSLTPSRRRRNMRQAFAVSPAFDLCGVHILVIDDVLTTGATANALAQSLRLGGAATVSLGVVARGIGLV